jgi:hypothetical protein
MQRLNISDLKKSAILPFTTIQTKNDWRKFVENHQIFTDERFEDDVVIRIDLNNNNSCDWVIPKKSVLLDFVYQLGNKIALDPVMLKIIEIWSFLTVNDQKISVRKIAEYRNAIADHLYGKKGMLTKVSGASVPMYQGKQISFGYMPELTAVIIDERYWQDVYKNGNDQAFSEMSYDDFMYKMSLLPDHTDALHWYSNKVRHPVIWDAQCQNIVSVWTKDRLNRYMLQNYNYGFYEYCPQFKSKSSKGLLVSVLDGLFLQADDSDGDMCALPSYYSTDIQNIMKKVHTAGKDYNYLTSEEYPFVKMLGEINLDWHVNYLMSEMYGNTSKEWDKNSFYLKFTNVPVKSLNKAYIDAVVAKKNIGVISTSGWEIIEIAKYLCKQKEITYKQFLSAISFYQRIIIQDGVIRSVKHDADAEIDKLTLDSLTENNEENAIKVKDKIYLPQQYLNLLIKQKGYPSDTSFVYAKILDFWRQNCALYKGKIDHRKATEIGKLIKASVVLQFGSESLLGNNQDMITCFNSSEVSSLPIYKTHSKIIDLINSKEDKLANILIDDFDSIY